MNSQRSVHWNSALFNDVGPIDKAIGLSAADERFDSFQVHYSNFGFLDYTT